MKVLFTLTLTLLIATTAAAQAPESTTQMKLAQQAFFQQRVEYLMIQQARTVLAEALNTEHHAARANYAQLIVRGNSDVLYRAVIMLVGGVNVVGTVTVNPGPPETVTTTVTDAALLSQIATFWNAMAGVQTGS